MKLISCIAFMGLLAQFAYAQSKIEPSKSQPTKQQVVPAPQPSAPSSGSASASIPREPAIPAAIPARPASFRGEKVYRIVNYQNFAMDVSATHETANIHAWDNHDGANQKWRFIPAGGDFYYIISERDRYAVDVQGGSLTSGTNIQAYRPNGTNAQRFKFIPIGNGQYWIQTDNGLNIVMQGSARSANIAISTANQDVSQRWVIHEL